MFSHRKNNTALYSYKYEKMIAKKDKYIRYYQRVIGLLVFIIFFLLINITFYLLVIYA